MADKPHKADAARRHLDELIEGGRSAYRIFTVIDALDARQPDTARLRASAIRMVGDLLAAKVAAGGALRKAAAQLLEAAHPDRAALFESWQRCLAAARPDTKAMKDICIQFPAWTAELPESCERGYLEFLPKLFRGHKREGVDVVPDLQAFVRRCGKPEQAARCFEFLAAYLPRTPRGELKGLCALAAFCCKSASADRDRVFMDACPPRTVAKDFDAEDFLVSAGAAMIALHGELKARAFDLFIALANRAYGSAEFAAHDLPRKLDPLPEKVRAHYVDAFARIADTAGIGATGFCAGRLHKLYASAQTGDVDALVGRICEIAAHYGPNAAQEFIERKTPASREGWPGE